MANEKKPPIEISLHPSDPPGNGHDGDEPSAPALFVGGTDSVPPGALPDACECPPEGHEPGCPRDRLARLAARIGAKP